MNYVEKMGKKLCRQDQEVCEKLINQIIADTKRADAFAILDNVPRNLRIRCAVAIHQAEVKEDKDE